jgi:transcriptional regulator of NAD metabolism
MSMRKKEIVKLINKVNAHKLIGQVCPPLHVVDDQWRFVFGRSLAYKEYQRYSAGRKLMKMAIFDRDFEGEYYWIPYDVAPNGYTSPGLRLQILQEVEA